MRRSRGQGGFTLLELVIVMAIIATMSSAGIVMYGNIRALQSNRKTFDTIQTLRDAYAAYYESNGVETAQENDAQIVELAKFSSLTWPAQDGWRKPMRLYRKVYACDNPSASASDRKWTIYDAVIISGGPNGAIETQFTNTQGGQGYPILGAGEGYLSLPDGGLDLTQGNDIMGFVNVSRRKQEKIAQARVEMERLKAAAMEKFDAEGAWPSGIGEIGERAGLTSKDAANAYLDPWRTPYQVIGQGEGIPGGYFAMRALGHDKTQGTADDIVAHISLEEYGTTIRARTLAAKSELDAALASYRSFYGVNPPNCTDNTTGCGAQLAGLGYVGGSKTFDGWGNLLAIDAGTNTFYSAGHDGAYETTDDF